MIKVFYFYLFGLGLVCSKQVQRTSSQSFSQALQPSAQNNQIFISREPSNSMPFSDRTMLRKNQLDQYKQSIQNSKQNIGEDLLTNPVNQTQSKRITHVPKKKRGLKTNNVISKDYNSGLLANDQIPTNVSSVPTSAEVMIKAATQPFQNNILPKINDFFPQKPNDDSQLSIYRQNGVLDWLRNLMDMPDTSLQNVEQNIVDLRNSPTTINGSPIRFEAAQIQI